MHPMLDASVGYGDPFAASNADDHGITTSVWALLVVGTPTAQI